MTKAVLFEIITAVEQAGYFVCAIVSDFDTSNQGLWSSLGISTKKCFFLNPMDMNRKIWTFADAPHMMKLIRNHLLDQGFILTDSTLVNRETLETLLEYNGDELKLCTKLNRKLLEVKGAERMRVSPAAKIFSSHTAALCKFVFPEKPHIANYFQLLNDWFDIFNSKIAKDDDVQFRSAYGMNLQNQNKKLLEVENMVSSMRCLFWSKKHNQLVPRAGLLPCQIRLIVSIRSLMGMFGDLRDAYSVSYIKTKNLNQDNLESHFSEVRSLGRTNDNPTQLEFRYRLKLLLMGAKVTPPVSVNVQVEDSSSNYMSRCLLERALNQNVFEEQDLKFPEPDDGELGGISTETEGVTFSEPIPLEDKITDASLSYLAGYFGYLIKKSGGKDYGEITRRQPLQSAPNMNMDNILDLWIHTLSRGGLIVSDASLISAIRNCEQIFNASYNPESLFNMEGISTKIFTSIKLIHPIMDDFVIKSFVKTRLMIRIKFMNSKLHSNKNRRKQKKVLHFQQSSGKL